MSSLANCLTNSVWQIEAICQTPCSGLKIGNCCECHDSQLFYLKILQHNNYKKGEFVNVMSIVMVLFL